MVFIKVVRLDWLYQPWEAVRYSYLKYQYFVVNVTIFSSFLVFNPQNRDSRENCPSISTFENHMPCNMFLISLILLVLLLVREEFLRDRVTQRYNI